MLITLEHVARIRTEKMEEEDYILKASTRSTCKIDRNINTCTDNIYICKGP